MCCGWTTNCAGRLTLGALSFVTSPSSESPGERLEVTSHTEVKLLEVKLLHETARAIETLGHAFPRPIRLVILVKTVK